MKLSKKWITMLSGAALVSAFALIFAVAIPQTASAHGGPGAFGRQGFAPRGAHGVPAEDSYLADALGITTDELQAAHEQAAEAALEQAVAEGLLTQEQADLMKERAGARGLGIFGKFGRFGSDAIDSEALLADALGISVDDLQAARAEARDAALAQAVADGKLTQEQVDEMKAAQALRDYLDEQGLQEQLRSIYESAVQDAVTAGVITQDQADQILSQQPGMGPRGFGGQGMRGSRGHGFGGKFSAPPATDSVTTQSSFSF